MCLPALQCRKAGSAALRLSKQNLPALRGEVQRAGFQPEIRCGSSGKENVPPWWLSWHPVKQGSCTRLPCPGRWRWGEDHTLTQMLSPDTDLHLIMGAGELLVDPDRPGCSSPRKDGGKCVCVGGNHELLAGKKPLPMHNMSGFTGIVIWNTLGGGEGFISRQRRDSAPDGGLLNLCLSPSSGHSALVI